MKLRNKKTGEVIDCKEILILREDSDGIWQVGQGNSLDQLNEDWEDFTEPAEPLIKDEKIRKAVLAWAEAEGVEAVAVMCHLVWGEKMTEIAKISNAKQEITFKGDLGIKMGNYTITELCGEEEE